MAVVTFAWSAASSSSFADVKMCLLTRTVIKKNQRIAKRKVKIIEASKVDQPKFQSSTNRKTEQNKPHYNKNGKHRIPSRSIYSLTYISLKNTANRMRPGNPRLLGFLIQFFPLYWSQIYLFINSRAIYKEVSVIYSQLMLFINGGHR